MVNDLPCINSTLLFQHESYDICGWSGYKAETFYRSHPKALAEVNGKTLLEHTIRYLQRFGIEDVIVNVHHFADQIEDVIE